MTQGTKLFYYKVYCNKEHPLLVIGCVTADERDHPARPQANRLCIKPMDDMTRPATCSLFREA